MWPGWNLWSFRHGEDTKLAPKLKCQLRLQAFDWSTQVSESEKLADIDGAARKRIIPIRVHQAARDHVEPRAGNHTELNPNVVQMFFFEVGGGLHFD